uniref:Uncharacterized protein n=1 Tax=Arundo donax TaxID=35708 RepID=A0A0A9DT04_ARUDO
MQLLPWLQCCKAHTCSTNTSYCQITGHNALFVHPGIQHQGFLMLPVLYVPSNHCRPKNNVINIVQLMKPVFCITNTTALGIHIHQCTLHIHLHLKPKLHHQTMCLFSNCQRSHVTAGLQYPNKGEFSW